MSLEYRVIHGDCLEAMRAMEDNSIDAIVTDPPAGIIFMGCNWDSDKGGRDKWVAWMSEVAAECLRVIKPGGHALVWALPRTSHWTGWAWESGGWEPRDRLIHLFGQGFPKSANVSKMIDRSAGAEREVVGTRILTGNAAQTTKEKGGTYASNTDSRGVLSKEVSITVPATEDAKRWDGWGSNLKPAVEDWWLFRKPLIGTIVENVLTHGTGALNIDGCRVGSSFSSAGGNNFDAWRDGEGRKDRPLNHGVQRATVVDGRWPANVVLSCDCEETISVPGKTYSREHQECMDKGYTERGATNVAALPGASLYVGGGEVHTNPECAAAMLDEQSGVLKSGGPEGAVYAYNGDGKNKNVYGDGLHHRTGVMRGDEGGASRFFYCAKVSRSERHSGGKVENKHPTVKPTALMRWLIKLITPPGGTILDPFCGSGSTLVAAKEEGFSAIGIEQEAEYVAVADKRVERARKEAKQLELL